MIQILESVGITDMTLEWFKSFLTGWQQTVRQKNNCSKPIAITRGIIQGENNSQMLFSLFINNLVTYIKHTKVILFADDVQLYMECDVLAINGGIEIINKEMKNVIDYCKDYGIKINTLKTKAIILSSKNNLKKLSYDTLTDIVIDSNKIEYVSEVRNLGYQLNRTLTSDAQISTIHKKVYASLGSIGPLKSILPSEIKSQLVKTLILPIIDYMDIVYHDFDAHGTKGKSEKLERLQNTCIRYILNVKRRDHITPHRKVLNMLTLFNRRQMHVLNMTHKIINNEAPEYLNDIVTINNNNIRYNNKLLIRLTQNNFHKTSMYVGAPKLWNELPGTIRNIIRNESFLSEIRDFLENK